MNDATEFESSLAGTLDFFQQLRRKLGMLETEAGAQREQLHAVAASVATLQEDWRIDQQAFATLAGNVETQTGELATLQSDSRLLNEQLTQLEATVACLQQDRQHAQETLATLAGHLRAQNAALRQELESTVAQRVAPITRVVALEEQLADQSQHLRDMLASLKSQGQDASQTRQDLQHQQDRQKHLETLLGKVAADTSSTRQILNVLQTDLTTYGDTLRELDQTWRDGLEAYQSRLSQMEAAISGSGFLPPTLAADLHPAATTPEPPLPATLVDQPPETPSVLLPTEGDRLAELAAAIATAREEQQALAEKLATVHAALADQDQQLVGLRDILAEQLQAQRQRLGELQTALDALRQTPPPATENDLQPLHEALTTQSEMFDQLQHSIRQQLHAQHERLGELEIALDSFQQASTAGMAAALKPLREALADHVESLDELRQTTQRQIDALATTLETQHLESQGVAERIDDLQRDIRQLQEQQALASDPTAQERHSRLEAHDPQSLELRQGLDTLQEVVNVLEGRLTSQAQAFSGNFEQLQGLNADIQDLQKQLLKLESPQRLNSLEQRLTRQEQEIVLLKEVVQQLDADSRQISEAARQDDHESTIAALEARLNEYQEHLTRLSATVETVQSDAKATQEKVLTMATNVAQRLHEFQNQLLAAKTSQGEHLQEIEQKLILLQAAVETQEAQRKTRRWFQTPTTLPTLVFTIGTVFLAAWPS